MLCESCPVFRDYHYKKNSFSRKKEQAVSGLSFKFMWVSYLFDVIDENKQKNAARGRGVSNLDDFSRYSDSG